MNSTFVMYGPFKLGFDDMLQLISQQLKGDGLITKGDAYKQLALFVSNSMMDVTNVWSMGEIFLYE
jgi:hypothetical protein